MSPRARFALLYAAGWIPFAAFYTLGLSRRAPPLEAVRSGLSTTAVAALLGIGVYRLMPFLRARLRRGWSIALAHLGLGALYSALWVGAILVMIRLGAPPAIWQSVWREYIEGALWFQFTSGVTLYGLLAGIFTAVDAARRLREQEAVTARAEALRIRAELRALRAQLDPHFLFNTLHSITALVGSEPRAAEEALERFGLLIRRVLDLHRQQRDEVTLGEELDFVRAYLTLESMRHGDRLRVIEEIEPDALEAYFPSFSLQPLVENAIRHGLAPLPRGGTLRIAASIVEDALHLEVADDGAGADLTRAATGDGVGLQVVRQRLAARFGARARLDITSAPSEGFRVRLVMPLVVRPAESRDTVERAVASGAR